MNKLISSVALVFTLAFGSLGAVANPVFAPIVGAAVLIWIYQRKK